MVQRLAHLSDLHIGRSQRNDVTAEHLCAALVAARVEQVVVTGDITHTGRRAQADRFAEMFAPLRDRLVVVPGNHDRAGEDVGARWMAERRVSVVRTRGLHLVRVDSTAPHNRSLLRSHGALCTQVLAQVDEALADASPGALVVLLLHHHLLPLPEESFFERMATLLGWPFASELPLGVDLLNLAEGRCDLVLHGHRHVPRAMRLGDERERPLDIYNAGSSTELGAFRVFSHHRGELTSGPRWVSIEGKAARGFPTSAHLLA